MTVYYHDDQVTLHHGRDLDVLRTLPDESVNCVVTSPPYYGLRDYGVDGQRGLEASPAEYVAGLVEVFAEVRRVLADDGTCWLNLGDSYSSGHGTINVGLNERWGNASGARKQEVIRPTNDYGGLPAKNLLGIPWKVAFALQEDSWTLRNAVVWAKPNAMPESVTDRLATRYELVFLLTKSRRYWFDLDAVREPSNWTAGRSWEERKANGEPMRYGTAGQQAVGTGGFNGHESGRNPGDVWTIPTAPFAEAHFAVMPLALAERCIQAGCPLEVCAKCREPRRRLVERAKPPAEELTAIGDKPSKEVRGVSATSALRYSRPRLERWNAENPDEFLGWSDCGCGVGFRPGVVLDPYSGSGTTGHAALRHGRRYIGIDLKAEYHDLALRTRLQQGALIPDVEVAP